MKKKGVVFILLGILGAIFVCTFDIIMGKQVNDITGPKSISALFICAILIIAGLYILLGKKNKTQA